MKSPIVIITVGLLFLAACTSENTTEEHSQDVIDELVAGNFDNVRDTYFSEELMSNYSVEDLKAEWEENALGDYVESTLVASEQQSYEIIEAEIKFQDALINVRLTWNDMQMLAGFHIEPIQQAVKLPDTLKEKSVTIGEGTAFELEGTLTLPKNREDSIPGVILVHGSGPSDQDEAVFQYTPFRDLAYGLAEQGIAVLRYPKRTFVHGQVLAETYGNEFTVQEETIDDAVLATEILQQDERIDNVFIIGHSLGGMVAPRIDDRADTDGMIILAGSPRSLWEIIYDQNVYMMDRFELDEEKKTENQQYIDDQKEIAESLMDMSKEEAKNETIFEMNGYYLKEMEQYDAGQIALVSEKPMLILQGETDFQVTMENDFSKWKEILREKDDATFKSYPGLNHFFITSEGPNQGTVNEYRIPGNVNEQVIQDIGRWIHEQSN